MAIDFPASPTLNQLFSADSKLWQWDGVAWTAYLAANNASLHGASHASTGVDPVTLAQSQVTGLTTSLSTINTSLSGKASTTHAASHASAGSDPITVAQSQVTSLTTDLAAKIPASTINAKGDLLVGSANDVVNILSVGTNGQLLTADSTQAYGIKWTNAPDTGITPFLLLGV